MSSRRSATAPFYSPIPSSRTTKVFADGAAAVLREKNMPIVAAEEASIYDVHVEGGGGGVSGNPNKVRTLSKGGCVNLWIRGGVPI